MPTCTSRPLGLVLGITGAAVISNSRECQAVATHQPAGLNKPQAPPSCRAQLTARPTRRRFTFAYRGACSVEKNREDRMRKMNIAVARVLVLARHDAKPKPWITRPTRPALASIEP